MTPDRQQVVITGGQGFVGRHLVQELQAHWLDATIHVWDLPEVDILAVDTYEARLQKLQPVWMIHLAALAAVGASFSNPARVHEVNVNGTERLLETLRRVSSSTKALVVSSSDIYGAAAVTLGTDQLAELSLTECKPASPYAESKLAMEQLIVERFNDFCIRVRPFPHLGPGQQLGFVAADFASQIAAIEAGRQEPVLRVGNLLAERDFTDVRDVVRAYRLLMEQAPMSDVFNVASGRGIAIQWLLDTLLSYSTQDIAVEPDPNRLRPSDTPRLVGDATKIRELTGWESLIPLEDTLRDVLNDWRERTTP